MTKHIINAVIFLLFIILCVAIGVAVALLILWLSNISFVLGLLVAAVVVAVAVWLVTSS